MFRDRRDRHRSKSRDSSSRGDKSVTIHAPGEPLLDAESTRGDDRVGTARYLCEKLEHIYSIITGNPYPQPKVWNDTQNVSDKEKVYCNLDAWMQSLPLMFKTSIETPVLHHQLFDALT